jgi:hypothetical protein
MMPPSSTPAIVLVYQDAEHRTLGLRLRDFFDRSGAHKTFLTEWKFEMLAHPGLSRAAAAEAATADLVVLATDALGPLPPYLKSWIESWCSSLPTLPATLAILLSGASRPLLPQWVDRDFLQAQAARGQRHFALYLAPGALAEGRSPAAPASVACASHDNEPVTVPHPVPSDNRERLTHRPARALDRFAVGESCDNSRSGLG